jgi:TolB-like protein/DNA-binding winged helix-turn-helix (wHTH) protein/Tfp pilus assembly protein PilF
MKNKIHNGFYIDAWWVSPTEGILTRGSETTRLEPKAMEVLVYLAEHPREVITREELERDVWRGAMVGYDAVTKTVIKLRKALQDNARQPRFIATIPKKGYQLIASISYPEDEDISEANTNVSSDPVAEVQQKPQLLSRYRVGILIIAFAGIVFLVLVWSWSIAPSGPITHPAGNITVAPPSIIVLPFENLGNDPKQEYLADGITEDIITDLSRLSNLLVIASNTSSRYKGRQVTPEEIGTDLNVEFVLKGSIRQVGNAVRVNAQLVNTKTGFNTWAQRYDRKLTEVFAVQDEVTQNIVSALAVKMSSQERNFLAKRATDNLKAYDFFQEGQKISKIGTPEAYKEARVLFQKAIELDPDYGRAYGATAVTLTFEYLRGWVDAPIETLDRALVLAKQAVALDDTTPQTYWALGFVYLMRKEYENAEQAAIQSIKIAPNYADGYGLLALIKLYLGQPEQAIEINAKGMRLNPYYSMEYLYTLGASYYMLGDYDAAVATLENAHERNQNHVYTKLFLCASYVKAGRIDDAKWIIHEIQTLNPTRSISELYKTIVIAEPEYKNALLGDLRKAGLPE